MRVELIAVGDELLYGDIVNGNAAWLGRELADVGLPVAMSTVVGDTTKLIAEASRGALARGSGAVLFTGGIGPTQDDLTREGIAAAAGVALHRDPGLESALREAFGARIARGGPRVPEMNYRQADLPDGASPLPNPAGTAPGIVFEFGGAVSYLMPGVPHEMKAMFAQSVLPDLLARVGQPSVVVHRVLRTAGMWESAVAEALAGEVTRLAPVGNPTIAFLASGGQTRVRISARARDRASALALIEPVETAARAALGRALYGVDGASLESVVLDALRARGETLAVAESLTGGLLAARITDVPGASAAFRGGVVTYATDAKASLLGVPAGVLDAHGAVSAETAAAMASGARELLGASYGLALTGVAGPDEQEGKPVGTVYLGLADETGVTTRLVKLPGGREQIRTYAAVQALDLLRRKLDGRGGTPD
jgi:nicotinamide-nucleotide amidase